MIKLSYVLIAIAFLACNSKPVKIEPINSNEKTNNNELAVKDNSNTQMKMGMTEGIHKVTVLDSLETTRYVYLKVKEGARNYWISTWKIPVEKGDVLYFKDGILKLNFYSKEHKRIFDTLYLTSKISKVPAFTKTDAIDKVAENLPGDKNGSKEVSTSKQNITLLKDLLSQPEKFKGKTIEVGGKCTKINMNIMGKNWIHIQEKDKSGKTYNLVVTSKDNVRIGENCYFEGVIDTKLDLGAGYFFDVIMQDGKRIY